MEEGKTGKGTWVEGCPCGICELKRTGADSMNDFDDKLDTLADLCVAGMKMVAIIFFIPLWVPLVFLGVLYNQMARSFGNNDSQ